MLDIVDRSAKPWLTGKALKLGGKAALAKPDLLARAIGWRALGSPVWPWERLQARQQLATALLWLWPQSSRQARSGLGRMMPDSWPWQRRQPPRGLSAVLRAAPSWDRDFASIALARIALGRSRPRRGLGRVLPDTWPWDRRQARFALSRMLPDSWPWERRQVQFGLPDIMRGGLGWQGRQARFDLGRIRPGWPWERRRAQVGLPGMMRGGGVPWRGRDRQLMLRRPGGSPPRAWQLLAAAAVGGGLVYFLDPQRGNRRRKMAAQRTAKLVRRSIRAATHAGRKMTHDISGKRQALMRGREAHEPLDDATLARKVESVLFRNPQVPKGRININAEHGVVVLRGEVEQPSDLRDIERTVKHIDGVQQVRSLLHIAGGAPER